MCGIKQTLNDRVEATREMAVAMCDDIKHMRTTITSNAMSTGDVRRLCGPFRRILIDKGGDISKVASPRIGKYELTVPDLSTAYKENRRLPYSFFFGGNVEVFGNMYGSIALRSGKLANPPLYHPDIDINVRIDGFINQKVLCINGEWTTRRDVITYISNVANGVHSGTASESAHRLLSRIRNSVRMRLVPLQGCTLEMDVRQFGFGKPEPIKFDAETLDLVALQFLSSVKYFVDSPAVKQLELLVASEV